jgi:hypothetical protein
MDDMVALLDVQRVDPSGESTGQSVVEVALGSSATSTSS